MNGLSPLSLRTMIDGKPVTYVIPASRKVECGATTRMGASFLDAWRPFTISLIPPTWYVPLPSEQIMGFNFLCHEEDVSQFGYKNPNQPPPFREKHAHSNRQHQNRVKYLHGRVSALSCVQFHSYLKPYQLEQSPKLQGW